MKTSFLTIVSVLSAIVASTSAFATGENTVTSKAYVDAMDATKQDIITAKTTGNVVTYNGTSNGQTQFDEVGIYDGSATYSNSDADKLVTAEVVHDFAAAVESITIPYQELVCENSDCDKDPSAPNCQAGSCTLWRIRSDTPPLTSSGTFYPLTGDCATAADCPACTRGSPACQNHVCACTMNFGG